MAHCTVPALFGIQKWFNARFADLCDYHDDLYITANIFLKFYGDYWLSRQFWKRKYRTLAVAAFIVNLTLGTLFWLLHRFDDAKRYLYAQT